jgi:anti-anti-sigma factor
VFSRFLRNLRYPGPERNGVKWTDIAERYHDKIVVLDVQGQVASGEPDPALHDRIVDLVDKGYRRFVIDLRRTPQMDSMALGEIVRGYIRALREGGAVKFVGATSRVRLLLDVTRHHCLRIVRLRGRRAAQLRGNQRLQLNSHSRQRFAPAVAGLVKEAGRLRPGATSSSPCCAERGRLRNWSS